MLKDRLKCKWTQQKASECLAASWGEIPAVGTGYPPRGGIVEGRTQCPLGWVPAAGLQQGLAQAGSGAWGWWADSISFVGVGERQAQPRVQCRDALRATLLREWQEGESFMPEAAVLRAGGMLSAHPGQGTQQQDLLRSHSLWGHRRHQALSSPRWEEEGLPPLEAGQGARQILVLHEPCSSKQRLRVTGLWGYFRCCWDLPVLRATRKDLCRGWETPKPVELHCTTREAETSHNFQFQTQRSHTWIRPLSVK